LPKGERSAMASDAAPEQPAPVSLGLLAEGVNHAWSRRVGRSGDPLTPQKGATAVTRGESHAPLGRFKCWQPSVGEGGHRRRRQRPPRLHATCRVEIFANSGKPLSSVTLKRSESRRKRWRAVSSCDAGVPGRTLRFNGRASVAHPSAFVALHPPGVTL